MLGVNAGGSCISGLNNTFLGPNASISGVVYLEGSFALGSWATITGYSQPAVAPNAITFTMSGLTASTSSTGTLIEFDGGNIIPYNTISVNETAITTIDLSITNGYVQIQL